MCAECNKKVRRVVPCEGQVLRRSLSKFTITRYTNTHPDIAGGMLCGPCDKEMGPAAVAGGIGKAGAGKAAAGTAPAKKKARAVKNKGVLTSEKPTIMSLTKCCIEVIGKAISDVEEFGDIGKYLSQHSIYNPLKGVLRRNGQQGQSLPDRLQESRSYRRNGQTLPGRRQYLSLTL